MAETANPAKPRKAYLSKSSRKPPAIQSEVVLRRAAGQTKTQIANDLDIGRNTVSSIVELSDIDHMIEDGRVGACKRIPKSLTVIDHHLERNSLTAALAILNPLVLSKEAAPRDSAIGSIHLQQTIQMLLHPETKPTDLQNALPDTTLTQQVQSPEQDKQLTSLNSDCVNQPAEPEQAG
jgi:hypothetical protein